MCYTSQQTKVDQKDHAEKQWFGWAAWKISLLPLISANCLSVTFAYFNIYSQQAQALNVLNI